MEDYLSCEEGDPAHAEDPQLHGIGSPIPKCLSPSGLPHREPDAQGPDPSPVSSASQIHFGRGDLFQDSSVSAHRCLSVWP